VRRQTHAELCQSSVESALVLSVEFPVILDSDQADLEEMSHLVLGRTRSQLSKDSGERLNESQKLLLLLENLLEVLEILVRVFNFFENFDQLLL